MMMRQMVVIIRVGDLGMRVLREARFGVWFLRLRRQETGGDATEQGAQVRSDLKNPISDALGGILMLYFELLKVR